MESLKCAWVYFLDCLKHDELCAESLLAWMCLGWALGTGLGLPVYYVAQMLGFAR